MLEKFKDLLYEISDLLLAIVILLIMSSVITWQVSDSMAFSEQNDEVNVGYVDNSTSEDLPVQDDINKPQDDTIIVEDNDDTNVDHGDISETGKPEEDSIKKDYAKPITKITIEIPSGTPGIGIAKILKDNNLIEDTSSFVARVEELNLAVKLKSGTYKIDSNTSLDDIIYIITGQKR